MPELKCVAVGDGCFAKVHSAVLSGACEARA